MLKKLLIAVVAIAVILAGIGFLLPSKVEVAREIMIEAPPSSIFQVVNRLDRHNEWSPWYGIDPDAKYQTEGPEGGVGQKMSWTSDHQSVGTGSQEIVESVEDELVRTALDFGDMGQGTAAFELEPSGSGTVVIWSFEADMGANPIGRYMGLMMDGWVGGDYERGLANLKELIENQ